MPYIPFTYIPSTGPSLAELLFPDMYDDQEEKSEVIKRWEREEEERRRKYGPYSTP